MTENLAELAEEMRRRGIPPGYFAAQMRRGMSPQDIFAAWPSRSRSERIGTRRFRRGLVLATYGGWLAVALLSRLATPIDSMVPVIPVVPLATALVALIQLSRRTFLGREVLAGDTGLDERLIQNRNRAFRSAFQLFAPFTLIAWLISALTIQLQPGNQGVTNALLIYSGAALLGTTLPAAIWAWREPDPTEPEEMPV